MKGSVGYVERQVNELIDKLTELNQIRKQSMYLIRISDGYLGEAFYGIESAMRFIKTVRHGRIFGISDERFIIELVPVKE